MKVLFSPTFDLDCLVCVDNVEGEVGDSLKLNNEDECFTCDFSDEGSDDSDYSLEGVHFIFVLVLTFWFMWDDEVSR